MEKHLATKPFRVSVGAFLTICAFSLSCAHKNKSGQETDGKVKSEGQVTVIRSDYAKDEITKRCEASIESARTKLDEIGKLPADRRTVDTTLLAFEKVMTDFRDETSPLTFMSYVSRDKAMAAEAAACEAKIGQFSVDVFSRRDLYDAVRAKPGRDADEKRLHFRTVEAFEQSGLKLNDEKLVELKKILTEISDKQTKFSTNLNTDASTIELTEAELKGTSADFLGRLKKNAAGAYIITTKNSDYDEIMRKAENSETRRKMLLAFTNRGTSENTKLLQETMALREKAAKLLGYRTWVDYGTVTKMAKSRANVQKFVNTLRVKLAKRNKSDYDQLLAFKKTLDPKAKQIDQWDILYLQTLLKKAEYSIDEEKVREYFPADTVVAGMFETYSKLFGVKFNEVKNAAVWSPDVKLYEIRDAKEDRRIAYFYTDFIPREGKYGHAAAFPLIVGRMINDTYTEPVAAIVANFSVPAGGKPSLLRHGEHGEVETLFHEFGHIMHQTLTRGRYGSLSGSSTARDFVEAPSQMLENWVWSPEIIKMISGHYLDSSQKLPQDLYEKLLKTRRFGQGLTYTRQLLFSTFDLRIHSDDAKKDVTEVFNDTYRKVIGQEPMPGAHFPQTFGHMMGGYDAGYYGYLWSEVYAQDMFSVFEKNGLLDEKTGARYRATILEQGDMVDPTALLKEFLKREPNQKAFLKDLGL